MSTKKTQVKSYRCCKFPHQIKNLTGGNAASCFLKMPAVNFIGNSKEWRHLLIQLGHNEPDGRCIPSKDELQVADALHTSDQYMLNTLYVGLKEELKGSKVVIGR